MTVFKVYLKVLYRYKFSVILYTTLLVAFAAINNQSRTEQSTFEASVPTICIEDLDQSDLSNDFIQYLDSKMEMVDLSKEQRKEALFYRELDYILTIPEDFQKDILNQKEPIISVEKSGDFSSYYANMIVEQYVKAAQIYASTTENAKELIQEINSSLETGNKVYMESTLDHSSLNAITSYYNFSTYSLLAGVLYIIGLTMMSFKKEEIQKRMLISSTKESSIQTQLWFCNIGYALVLWGAYVGISYVICGNIVFSQHGLYYILNSFLYLVCATSMAFFISTLVKSREAINGIVNIVGLGSAFLCGAFLPVSLLPAFVLKIARVLPAYWFVQSNEILRSMEVFNANTLQPIYTNMIVVCMFSVLFFAGTIISTKMRTKV